MHQKLYWSRFSGGVWSAPEKVLAALNPSLASPPSLSRSPAGDSTAEAELAYVDSAGTAHHTRFTGAAWTDETSIGGPGLSHVAIAAAP